MRDLGLSRFILGSGVQTCQLCYADPPVSGCILQEALMCFRLPAATFHTVLAPSSMTAHKLFEWSCLSSVSISPPADRRMKPLDGGSSSTVELRRYSYTSSSLLQVESDERLLLLSVCSGGFGRPLFFPFGTRDTFFPFGV